MSTYKNLFVLMWLLSLSAGGLGAVQNRSSPSTQQPSKKKSTSAKLKFFSPGALAFGDVYAVPIDHLPEAEGSVGAWIRRAYLTGDFNISKQIFARARVEINQDGDFVSHAFTADLKDLFVRWTVGQHKLIFGRSSTPTFDLVEELWGYRHLEKTPLDLQGLPSRDWGIAAHGPLSLDHAINYQIMVGAGGDIGRETGESPKIMGRVSFGDSKEGLLVGLYADYQRLPGLTDRTTGQVNIHFPFARGRIGGLYSYQDRQADPRLEVASAYGIVDLSSKVSLIGRLDRLLSPSPSGNSIDYLPFDPSAKATLLIGGIEWRPCRYFSLTPNLESILYDRDDRGDKPQNDLLLRLTFYVHY